MSAFDLITRLFGLLLGLAMGEILSGLARTMRLRANVSDLSAKEVRIGYLVPLLGTLLILEQLSFWLNFYELHGDVPLNLATLIGFMLVVGGFYLISGFVFPVAPARWPDFDEYYMRVRHIVIGGLLAIKTATIAYVVWRTVNGVPFGDTTGTPNTLSTAAALLYLPILVALLAVRRANIAIALLVAAIAIVLMTALTGAR